MLADDAEHDVAFACSLDHRFRGGEIGRDGLLHLHMLFGLDAKLDGFQTKIGEGADVDEIDARVTANVLPCGDGLASVLRAELLRATGSRIACRGDFKSDIRVRLRVLM